MHSVFVPSVVPHDKPPMKSFFAASFFLCMHTRVAKRERSGRLGYEHVCVFLCVGGGADTECVCAVVMAIRRVHTHRKRHTDRHVSRVTSILFLRARVRVHVRVRALPRNWALGHVFSCVCAVTQKSILIRRMCRVVHAPICGARHARGLFRS